MGTPISRTFAICLYWECSNPSEQLFRTMHLTVAILTIQYHRMLGLTPLAWLHPVPRSHHLICPIFPGIGCHCSPHVWGHHFTLYTQMRASGINWEITFFVCFKLYIFLCVFACFVCLYVCGSMYIGTLACVKPWAHLPAREKERERERTNSIWKCQNVIQHFLC